MNTNQPADRHFSFWSGCLVWTTGGVIATGICMATMPEMMNGFFSRLFFFMRNQFPLFGEPAATYITFTHGMQGSMMVGWGVALMAILFGPFRSGNRNGWIAIALSIGIWFTLGCAISLRYGFWQSAILNLIVAEFYAIALARTFRSFFPAND